MKITIITVGKIKEKFTLDACLEYEKRLTKYVEIKDVNLPDEAIPDKASDAICEQILLKEGQKIKNVIPKGSFIVALAIEGKEYDSVEFAHKIEEIYNTNAHITFIIGASLGLDPEIKRMANLMLSFSKMTFPHNLMKVILLEQIYRAFKILNGEKYHK